MSVCWKEVLGLTRSLIGGSITRGPTHFSEGPTFVILGHPAPLPDQRPRTSYDQVSPNFFHTIIYTKKERYLDDHDTNAAPWAVVVNEAFVRQFFPNEDPIETSAAVFS